AVERHAAADGRGVSAEPRPEGPRADERGAVVSLEILVGSERPAIEGMRSQHLQESRRHLCDPDPLGAVAGLQRGGAGIVAAEALQKVGFAKVVELWNRERAVNDAEPRELRGDRDQPRLLAPSQGTQEDGMDHAEDRGGGADPE